MLHVLHGEDDFTARETITKLVNDARFANNVERFDGAEADLTGIRLASETMPFLAEGRLVIVDRLPKPKREAKETESAAPAPPAGAAPAAKGKKSAKKPSAAMQAKEFGANLAALGEDLPAWTTLVVFVHEELPKTHPLLSAAQAHGKVHHFAPPTGAPLEKWITQRATSEGVTLQPEAARRLAQLAAGQLQRLATEIAKLATYVGPGGTIDVAAVEVLVPDSRETRAFDLTDALARGERSHALALLHELLDAGQQPLMILALIARQIRILVQVKDLAGQGVRSGDIATAVGLAPFLVDKTVALARRFSFDQLAAAQRACLEVDTALKRSRMTPDLALDLLISEFGRARVTA